MGQFEPATTGLYPNETRERVASVTPAGFIGSPNTIPPGLRSAPPGATLPGPLRGRCPPAEVVGGVTARTRHHFSCVRRRKSFPKHRGIGIPQMWCRERILGTASGSRWRITPPPTQDSLPGAGQALLGGLIPPLTSQTTDCLRSICLREISRVHRVSPKVSVIHPIHIPLSRASWRDPLLPPSWCPPNSALPLF